MRKSPNNNKLPRHIHSKLSDAVKKTRSFRQLPMHAFGKDGGTCEVSLDELEEILLKVNKDHKVKQVGPVDHKVKQIGP